MEVLLTQVLPLYGLLFVVYGRKHPKRFLLLTGILSIPFKTTVSLTPYHPHPGWISGITLYLSDVSFIALAVHLWIRGEFKPHTAKGVMLALLGLLLSSVLSLINSIAGMHTVYQILLVLKWIFLYYVVVTSALSSEGDIKALFFFFSLSLLLQGLIACAQVATGNNFLLFSTGQGLGQHISIAGGRLIRVFGTIAKPNGFAMYICPLLLINLSLLVGSKTHRQFRALVMGIGLMALLFSFSRGGWLSFSCGFLVFLFVVGGRGRINRAKLMFGTLFVGFLVFIAALPILKERLYGDDYNAAASRIPLMKLTFEVIKDHPIVGVGANTLSIVMFRYRNRHSIEMTYVAQVHNQYLLIIAECGLIGLGSFLALMRANLRLGKMAMRRVDQPFFYFAGFGVLLGFLAAAVHMMVDMYNSNINVGSLLVMSAALSAMARCQNESYGKIEEPDGQESQITS